MSNPIPGNKPFKKGQSGNPKGRPRKLPELTKLLDEVLGEEKNNVTAMEAVVKSLLSSATKGDTQAARVLLEYSYGKPKANIELSGPGGGPVFEGVEVVIKRSDEAKD